MAAYYSEKRPMNLTSTQYYSTDSSGKQTVHEEFTGSNLYAGLGIAGFAGDLMSSYMQIGAAEDQADSYRFKAERAKMAGEFAATQTKLNNANLMAEYNETQANALVMGAIQGRTGGTLANLAAQDAENLAWDMEFMELSGIVQKAGYDIEAAGYRQAAAKTVQAGYKQAAVGLLGSAAKFAKVL